MCGRCAACVTFGPDLQHTVCITLLARSVWRMFTAVGLRMKIADEGGSRERFLVVMDQERVFSNSPLGGCCGSRVETPEEPEERPVLADKVLFTQE